jgi:hypothetical protein
MYVEGHRENFWAIQCKQGSLEHRQVKIDYSQTLARMEKAGTADMLVTNGLKGNIPNPITAEIERTVDELIGLCRVAGQMETDLTTRGKKRHAKTELRRINKIVDQHRKHLLDGITAIRNAVEIPASAGQFKKVS